MILNVACAGKAIGPDDGGAPRIVCLSGVAGEVLVALGAGSLIVAGDSRTASLSGMASIPVVEELSDGLSGLRPTHVIVGRDGISQERPGVASGASTGYYRYAPHTIDDVLNAYRDLGRIAGRPEQAEALVGRLIRELAAVSASTYGLARPRVALVVSDGGWHTPGGDSYVTNLIEIGGGENVLEPLTGKWPAVDLDALASLNPDVVLDATGYRPGSEAEAAARIFWKTRRWVSRVEFLPGHVIRDAGPSMPQHAGVIRAALFPRQTDLR